MNVLPAISRLTFWCCIALWLIAMPVASFAATRFPIGDPAKSKSYIEAASVFTGSPCIGFDTIRFTVHNDTNEPLKFSIRSNNKSGGYRAAHVYEGEQTITAPKQQTSTHLVLVPICTIPDTTSSTGYYSYGDQSRINVSGAATFDFNTEEVLSKEDISAAFSNDLTVGGGVSRINSERFGTTSSSPYGRNPGFAVGFDPANLPTDWRTFSGFDYVSFSEASWLGLDPALRASVLQWVGFGGCLTIYSVSASLPTKEQLQIAAKGDFVGAGKVRILKWDGKSLDRGQLQQQYPKEGSSTAPLNQLNTLVFRKDNHWANLSKALGSRSFDAWLIGLILIAFGLLVGPINLFYLAKAGRRQRLFFTTPIISLGASVLLIIYILFQDGTGGSGVRTSLVYVNPDAATASIRQDQISRTGVLFSTSFTTDEPAMISPALLETSRWTRLKPSGYNYNGQEQRYSQSDPKSFAGDWFQSRSEQGQCLQLIRSSRGRMELAAASAEGQPPSLRSSFSYAIETVFYFDEKEQLWKSTSGVKTGGTLEFERSTMDEFTKALKTNGLATHPQLRNCLKSLQAKHFYGFTTDPNAEFITTLKTVAWKQNISLVWGPVP